MAADAPRRSGVAPRPRAAVAARRLLARLPRKPRRGDRPRRRRDHRAAWRSSPTSSRRTRPSSSSASSCKLPPVWDEGGNWTLPPRHRRARPRHALAPHLRRAHLAVHRPLGDGRLGRRRRRRSGSPPPSCGGIVDVADHARHGSHHVDPRASCSPSSSSPSSARASTNTIVAVTVVYLPHYVRLVRASALERTAQGLCHRRPVAGVGPLRLMFVTVLPNCLAPLIVQAALGVSDAILEAAALGFLGLGAQPPTPEWGSMLADCARVHHARIPGS